MKFRTTIRASGKTATGIPVPDWVVQELGAGKRPPVTVTVGGHTYRSSIASMGGAFMISLSAENRARSGVAAGEEVEVEVELDTAPRQVSVPEDLVRAFGQDSAARRAFEALSYSKQRWHVLGIEGARTPETRARRIAKSVAILRGDE
jgi:hypothetical protein